ncbi:MAG: PAS domain S-box protein [Nitrospirota bacterium]
MSAQPVNIRVLLVEDSADDALLTLRQLKQGGFAPDHLRVDTRPALEQALREREWDIVLCDYRMPGFDGAEALKLVRQSGQDIPFIIISGTIGEETAVALMKAGAHDFLLKDAMGRLVPAVERELREAGVRREKRQKEAALLKSEANLKKAEQIAMLGNWEWNILTGELTWSDEVYRIYGMDPARDTPSLDVVVRTVAPEDRDRFVSAVDDAVRHGKPFEGEYRMIGLDGAVRYTHTAGEVVRNAEGRPVTLFGIVRDITRRRKVEVALRRAEALYHELVETAQDLIWQCDADGRYIYLNAAWEDVLGYRLEEMLGRKFSDFQEPETARRDQELFGKLLQGGTVKGYETVHRSKQGGSVHLVFNAKYVRDEAGTIRGTRGTAYDITERKRAEERLAHMHGLMQYVISHAQRAIAVHDRELRYIYVSDQYLRQYNVKEHDVIGKRHYDVFPDLPQKWRDVHQRVLAGAVEGRDEDPYVRADGSVDWTRWECRPWYESDGSIGGLIVYTEVITERKRRELALRESESLLKQSQAVARIGHYVLNVPDGTWTSSDMLDSLFGIDPSYPRTIDGWLNIIHPEQREEMRAYFTNHVLRDRHPFDREYRIVRASDHAALWVHGNGKLEYGDEGRLLRMFGTIQDITARKQAEEKLRESEQFIRGILDTVDEGFIVIDRDYRIVTANRAYCGQASLPCGDIIGKHCYEISHRTDRPCYEEGEPCAVRKVFETGESQAVFHKHMDREGHILFVETKAFPTRDAAGTVVSAIETISNITEKHLLEEERLKTQKLESIGTLAGGIAHDFNNLLQGVFGYISMARMMYDEKEKSLAMLEQAEQAVHQSVNLTSQLLTFSKGGKPVKKVVDLRPVIDNAAKFALSGSRSGFQLDMQPGLWRVDADGGQIGQVIQNIVLNADQAMPLGGRVTITARNLPASEAASRMRLDRRDHILISIEDQGVGIPEACLDKIFDPYFTTKEKGSGLGLATSYSIIRNHGGRIEVSSVVGRGTVFRLCLPAVRSEASESAERPRSALKGPVRILLMDDEEIIRKVARELLGIMGHIVEFAAHGDEAIGKYRQAMAEGSPFDVVILDLTIRGGRGGAETARALQALDPGVKAIVSSGYSDDEVIATYRQHGFRAFLKKPYTIEDLGRALADAEV